MYKHFRGKMNCIFFFQQKGKSLLFLDCILRTTCMKQRKTFYHFGYFMYLMAEMLLFNITSLSRNYYQSQVSQGIFNISKTFVWGGTYRIFGLIKVYCMKTRFCFFAEVITYGIWMIRKLPDKV